MAFYSGTNFDPTQSSRVRITQIGPGASLAPIVLMTGSGSAATGYVPIVIGVGVAYLYRLDAGVTFTGLAGPVAASAAAGDELELVASVSGSTVDLTLKLKGVTLITYSDSSGGAHLSGGPGFMIRSNEQTNGFTQFVGAGLAALTAIVGRDTVALGSTWRS